MNRRKMFIRAVAEFLARDAALYSIKLEMISKGLGSEFEQKMVDHWRNVHSCVGDLGWSSVEETERKLIDLLYGPDMEFKE